MAIAGVLDAEGTGGDVCLQEFRGECGKKPLAWENTGKLLAAKLPRSNVIGISIAGAASQWLLSSSLSSPLKLWRLPDAGASLSNLQKAWSASEIMMLAIRVSSVLV